MSRNLLNRKKTSLESKEVAVFQQIEAPGKYIFEITDVKLADSRHNLDGTEKESLPEYKDETRELFIVLKNPLTGKGHMTRLALDSFLKFDNLSEAERKELKPYKLDRDEMDGYATYINPETKQRERIPAQEGDKEFEGLQNIFSRFVSALGLPEGTVADKDYEQFKGRMFQGILKENDYTNRAGEDKSRLKLSASFYALTDAEIQAVEESKLVPDEFR